MCFDLYQQIKIILIHFQTMGTVAAASVPILKNLI